MRALTQTRRAVAFAALAFACLQCGAVSAAPATANQPTAAPATTPPPWLDPFCQVTLRAAPIDTAPTSQAPNANSQLLGMVVFSQSGASIDAHVTLLSDTEAYDVALHRVPVTGENYDRRSRPILIQLPKAVAIAFAYVDSYALDGGSEQSCPSEPFDLSKVKPLRVPPPPAQVPRVIATFKQALPPLPCGKLFSNAEAAKPMQPVYPQSYFDHSRTVQIEIFVDSNGNVIKTYVYKSSGSQAFDDSATVAALQSKFKPAMLLCTPVVSTYLFRADFDR